MKDKKKAIVIVTYSRAALLKLCLESIFNAKNYSDYLVIVIWQQGFSEIGEILDTYSDKIELIVKVDGSKKSVVENISRNRFLGNSIAFDFFQCDYAIGLEDDVQISYDALQFVNFVFLKFKNKSSFRGVNLGSLEPRSQVNADEYSLLRFGLHGPASAISRKTWNHYRNKDLLEFGSSNLFDGIYEHYIKTGFMVTPNQSRFLDSGWGGTHTLMDPNDRYFSGLRNSWLGLTQNVLDSYEQKSIRHSWRFDSINFRRFQSLKYWLYYFVWNRRDSRFSLFMIRSNHIFRRLKNQKI